MDILSYRPTAHRSATSPQASLHFSIMTLTTVGYGDVLPLTNMEYGVVAIYMTVGGFVWAYIIGSLTTVMSSMNGHGQNFKNRMDEVSQWVNRLPTLVPR